MADEPGVERRLAAILAADVVGYSRLMEADEAGTHARLKALRKEFIEPRIAEHHGRVVKLTGDGALVEFPSVVEAVLCAVDVQRIVAERNADVPQDQRIEFRIGVNLGDVIIEDDDLYGDGVNVAARLQTLAEPGGICVVAHRLQPCQEQGRPRLRADGRAQGQEHRRADHGLPGAARLGRSSLGPYAGRARSRSAPLGGSRGGGGRVACGWRGGSLVRPLAAGLRATGAAAVAEARKPSPRCRCPTSPRSRCCRSRTSRATQSRSASPAA